MRVPHICKPVTPPPPVPAVYNLNPIQIFLSCIVCKSIFFILSLSMCEY